MNMHRSLIVSTVAIYFLCLAGQTSWAQPIPGDPLPGAIQKTPFRLQLEDVIQIPATAGSPRLEQLIPWGDGSDRLLVSDQHGKIYTFSPGDTTPTLVLDVAANAPGFRDGGQQGLRSFALHPDFATPGTNGFGKLFTSYSTNRVTGTQSDHDSVVAEWQLSTDGTVDTSIAPREILRVGQPLRDHNIGRIAFNPNVGPGEIDYGNLYIAFGDGGKFSSGLNPNGQDTNTLLGTLLRIDPLQDAAGGNAYAVPADNPFVNDAAFRPEIWAYGLRNPHQFSWDREGTGKMLIADIGQDNIEEVNIGVAGANYGWPAREGTFDIEGKPSDRPMATEFLPADHATDAFTYPAAQYDHAPGDTGYTRSSAAIAGGYVYRGTRVPELDGKYIFGDFSNNTGPIFVVDVEDLTARDDFSDLLNLSGSYLAPIQELQLTREGQDVTLRELIREAAGNDSLSRTDMRFGYGADGEVYVLNKHDGWVRTFATTVPEPASSTLFALGFALFAARSTRRRSANTLGT